MQSEGKVKTPHMGRRRLVMLGIGVGVMAVGVFVLADQAFVAGLIGPVLGSSSLQSAGGFTPYGNLSYVAYILGFGILMSGVGILRSTMRSSLTSYASRGSAMGGGYSPEAMQKMMETSMAQMNAAAARASPAAQPAPVVKVKCKACGSLEEPDAAFCHKCGAAM